LPASPLIPKLPLRHRDRLVVPFDAQLLPLGAASGRVETLLIERVGLGAQVGEVLVAAADGSFVPQGSDVDGCGYDCLSRTAVGPGEAAAVDSNDYDAARLGEACVVRQARRL